MAMSKLAFFGGPKAVTADEGDIFRWPIITAEDEAAVLDVLRRGAMSGWDLTLAFEEDLKSTLACSTPSATTRAPRRFRPRCGPVASALATRSSRRA